MKILLSLLGSISLTTGVAVPLAGVFINEKHNPIDRSEVSIELQLSLTEFENFYAKNVNSVPDEEIILNFTNTFLALKDINTEEFYRRYLDLTWNVFNKYSSRLETVKVPSIENYKKFVNKEIQYYELVANLKFNSNISKQFYIYKEAKELEAKLYFQIYDQIITKETLNASLKQNQVNDLINENEKLDERIKGLEQENEIHHSIIKVLQETKRLLEVFKRQFNTSYHKMDSSYRATEKYARKKWVGWIPIGGAIMAGNFKNATQRTLEEMEVFAIAFDEGGELAEAMKEFTNQASGAVDQIIANSKDKNFTEKFLESLGIPNEFEVIGGITVNINDSLSKAFTKGVWDKFNGFLNFLFGSGFVVNELAKFFKDQLKPEYTSNIIPHVNQVQDIVNSTAKQIDKDIEISREAISTNDNDINDALNKISENTLKIDKLNDEITESLYIKDEVQNEFIDTSIELLISGHTYNWYIRQMLEKQNDQQRKITSFEERLEQYKNAIELEQQEYLKLIEILNENSALEKEFKNRIINDHNLIYKNNVQMYKKLESLVK